MESNKIFQEFINIPIRITDERIDHIIESHPEMKNYIKEIIESIKTPDEIYYSENSLHYIFIKKYNNFIGENLIAYIKKTNGDGFIISSHPISNKRLTRSIKKWKLLKK